MCILFVSSLSNNNLIREKVLNRNISSVVSFSNRIFQNDLSVISFRNLTRKGRKDDNGIKDISIKGNFDKRDKIGSTVEGNA